MTRFGGICIEPGHLSHYLMLDAVPGLGDAVVSVRAEVSESFFHVVGNDILSLKNVFA